MPLAHSLQSFIMCVMYIVGVEDAQVCFLCPAIIGFAGEEMWLLSVLRMSWTVDRGMRKKK